MFDLSLEMLRVVEEAAIASARTMGMGDPNASDQAAVESMRRCLDTLAIEGTIVIGEGERDEAPMLYIGEKVGAAVNGGAMTVDIAVDPLEGTNLCATGGAGAITVLAASERGGLLHAPDCYMEKIVVGPAAKGAVDLDAPVKQNLKAIARRLRTRRGRSRGGGARSPAPRQTDRRHPRGRRAHPSDLRWRSLGRHRGQRGGHRSARRDGLGRRARGSPHGRRAALPEWRDPGPPGGQGRCPEGAHAGHGHHRRQPHLHHARTRARPQSGLRRLRRHRTATCCRASASPATAFTRSPSS